MKQIKTILRTHPGMFDNAVNEALAEGWVLNRRYFTRTDPTFFVAELEMEVITEAERCCENCLHCEKDPAAEPCFSCSETASEWEPRDA